MACRWRIFAARPESARRRISIGRSDAMDADRDASAQAARGRERQATEGGCRSEPRQEDASGRTPPKALKPVRKRKLVDEMRGDKDVSIRRACRVFLVDTYTYHYKSRRPGQAPSNNGSERFARRGCATAIGASMCYCAAKAGLSVKTRRGTSIANWACNCATKRRSAGSRRSCATIAAMPPGRTRPGQWTSCTISLRPARGCPPVRGRRRCQPRQRAHGRDWPKR